jgi:AraC family transcriptional regulator
VKLATQGKIIAGGPAFSRVFRDPRISVTHAVTSAAIPLHAHSEYVFGYYFRGLSSCRVASRSDLDFSPGDLGLLNPGDAHEDFASDSEREYLTVNVKKELFQDLLRDVCAGASHLPFFTASKLSNDAQISRICESIRCEVDNQNFGREVVIRSLVTQLAIYLLRQLPAGELGLARDEESPVGHRQQVRRASEYLQDNCSREFNLDHIAAVAGLSKYHLERVFKRATGLNLHTYMVLVRVDRAKQALTTTPRSIADIALEFGFSDQSHFTNVFRRFVGLTPHAYRLATR